MAKTDSTVGRLVAPGILLVFVTALISGVSTFVNTYAVAGTSSDAFVTVRNLAVALMIVPVAFIGSRAGSAPLTRRDWSRLVAIGIIGGAIPFLLFFHGLQLATAAGGATTASFLYRTLFLMATVLGIVVLREKFHWRVALAAGLLLGGSYLMLSLTSSVLTDGTLYVLAATALWAVEYTISKRALRDLPSSTVALGRMGIGAVALFGYLGATSQLGAIPAMSGGQWVWVLISAAFLMAFVATWYAGLKRVDLGVATSVLVLGYPITWLLGVLVRGSRFTTDQALGVAVVVAGVTVVVGATMFRETGRYILRALRPAAAA
jgi:drug/metabolite transporter (DMT)-like permease